MPQKVIVGTDNIEIVDGMTIVEDSKGRLFVLYIAKHDKPNKPFEIRLGFRNPGKDREVYSYGFFSTLEEARGATEKMKEKIKSC